jgi:Glycosyl transferase family 11
MFQYAFGLTAAGELDTSFWYDTSELARYFVLGEHERRRPLLPPLRRREIVTDDRDDPVAVLSSLTDHTVYGGYFYGAGYPAPATAEVKEAFSVRGEVEASFRQSYRDLLAMGYVCAHVRLTDFFTYRDDVTLPPGYFRRALEALSTPLPVVFVSDDIATVRDTLADIPGMFEQNDEITDFLLLRHASVVISSNSSFSWWAAWLNEDARVIAPRHWLGLNQGAEFPPGTILPTWERIPARAAEDGSWRRNC